MSLYEARDAALKEAAARFKRDAAQHQMTVLHDDGLYRHLQFRQPKRSTYWFDLVTWPGYLSFTGDGNGFVFSRTEDMFEFFLSSAASCRYDINPGYWAEKVVSGSEGVEGYSEALFNEQVAEDLAEAEKSWPGVGEAWAKKTSGFWAEHNLEYEQEALSALNDFSYLPEGGAGEPYRLPGGWEMDWKDYHWWFLWSCHAILWGIKQYAAAKAPVPAGDAS